MTTEKNPTPQQIKDKDFDLIQAINAGEVDKFQDLVKRYEAKLYNFSLRMCRDPSDAEDMIQDTFLNVFRYLKNFRYEAKFKNWLYKIAASVCIKKKRRRKHAPDQTLSLEDFLPGDEAEVARKIPRWTTIPLDQLLNEELAEVLSDTIHALPEKYRIVAILRDVEGFSTAETANILDISPANVKVRLHRARLFLRDKLKNYFEHDHNHPSA